MKIFSRYLFVFFLIAIFPICVFAASESQLTTLTILPGNISIIHTPNNFIFDTVFIDKISTYELYKTLEPSNFDNQLIVEDADLSGLNFNVTLALSNLVDNTAAIPFSNISIISISDDPFGVDTASDTSPPANLGNVSAPQNCPWSGDIETNCQSFFNLHYFSGTPIIFAMDPTIAVTPASNNIYVNNLSLYYTNEIIEFSDGEKALIKNIIQGTGGYLEVERGILGTTPAAHLAGSGIINHSSESDQVLIMDGPEPPAGRMGAYSIGFGFKSLIEPFFEPGNYTGTITYSLYIT